MKLKSLLPIGLAGTLAIAQGAYGGDSRGIRNNNPGNIKKTSIEWKGASGDDGIFVKFSTPEYGIRAMARILKVYDSKYNINTIEKIIKRWSATDQDPYIKFVSKRLNKSPKEKLNVNDSQVLLQLISAMIHFENGSVPYSEPTLLKGINAS